jgi:NTE family protein
MASCGFLPEFAPLEVDGRLLGDGGLSLNAPFDPMLVSDTQGGLLLHVVDLYARDGARPESLEAALERKNDLLFGNQTFIRLKYCLELQKLRRTLKGTQAAGARKDYAIGRERKNQDRKSRSTSPQPLAQRWHSGFLDMEYSARMQSNDDLVVVSALERRLPPHLERLSCVTVHRSCR